MNEEAGRAPHNPARAQGGDALDIAMARNVVRGRLAGRGISGDTLDDLCQEALGRLIATTRHGAEQGEKPIQNLSGYSLTLADRVFDDHIRRTRPNWCRLRRRILYLLDLKRPGNPFARWRMHNNWLGGLVAWRGQAVRGTRLYQMWRENPAGFWRESGNTEEPASVPMQALLYAVFRSIRTPLEISELTTHVADLQSIDDSPSVSLEDSPGIEAAIAVRACDMATRIVDDLAADQLRDRLWQLLCELPINQRTALLLGLSRSELILIACVTHIADALQVSIEEMAGLWSDLPLADRAIAERLQLTPKQISNLRKCARERLARGLARLSDT